MKFVNPLTKAEEITLKAAWQHGPSARVRQRAQAIYWSHQGYRLSEIAKALGAHYTSVSGWLNRWESQGLRGLYEEPRSGRPPIYTESEAQRLQELIDQEPRQTKQAQAQLIRETGKVASRDTLKRLLKKKIPVETVPEISEVETR